MLPAEKGMLPAVVQKVEEGVVTTYDMMDGRVPRLARIAQVLRTKPVLRPQ